jgi:ABC-type phosphate/phosphonate transport system substrate-binding protein
MRPKRGLPLAFGALPVGIHILMLAGALLAAPPAGTADPDSDVVYPLRVAFSSSMFTDVNANDAKASVKAWSQQMAEDMDMKLTVETHIEPDPDRLQAEYAAGNLECISLTTVEFLGLEDRMSVGPIFIGEQAGGVCHEYILLVKAESALNTLMDLRDKSLIVFDNPRTCLALPWLDVALRTVEGARPETFLGSISHSPKLSQTVLPVFFGQSDACLVTRSGFDTMVELNPQVGRSLREVASSPKVVSMLVVIRDDADPKLKANISRALLDAGRTPSGRQLLTLFQTTGLCLAPDGCFDSARALMAGELPLSMVGHLLARPEGTK